MACSARQQALCLPGRRAWMQDWHSQYVFWISGKLNVQTPSLKSHNNTKTYWSWSPRWALLLGYFFVPFFFALNMNWQKYKDSVSYLQRWTSEKIGGEGGTAPGRHRRSHGAAERRQSVMPSPRPPYARAWFQLGRSHRFAWGSAQGKLQWCPDGVLPIYLRLGSRGRRKQRRSSITKVTTRLQPTTKELCTRPCNLLRNSILGHLSLVGCHMRTILPGRQS